MNTAAVYAWTPSARNMYPIWLTVRLLPGEVLADSRLKRTVYWSSRGGLRRAGHRPDLVRNAQVDRHDAGTGGHDDLPRVDDRRRKTGCRRRRQRNDLVAGHLVVVRRIDGDLVVEQVAGPHQVFRMADEEKAVRLQPRGDALAYVPADRTVFTGDLLFVSTSNGQDESHVNIPSPKAPSSGRSCVARRASAVIAGSLQQRPDALCCRDIDAANGHAERLGGTGGSFASASGTRRRSDWDCCSACSGLVCMITRPSGSRR